MNNRLFIGVFPAGLSFADRGREEHGEYARLAFMPYATLEAEYSKSCPPELRTEIEGHVADMQRRRGEQYRISAVGQTVTLGGDPDRETNTPRQRG
jgi:hypothetical protein